MDSLLSRKIADEHAAAIDATHELSSTRSHSTPARPRSLRAFSLPVEHDEAVVNRLREDLTAASDRAQID